MKRVRVVVVPWTDTGPWALAVYVNDHYQRYVQANELPGEILDAPPPIHRHPIDIWFVSRDRAERAARYIAILENA